MALRKISKRQQLLPIIENVVKNMTQITYKVSEWNFLSAKKCLFILNFENIFYMQAAKLSNLYVLIVLVWNWTSLIKHFFINVWQLYHVYTKTDPLLMIPTTNIPYYLRSIFTISSNNNAVDVTLQFYSYHEYVSHQIWREL